MVMPWRWAYVVLLIASLFCSLNPKDTLVPLGIVLFCYAYLALVWLMRLLDTPVKATVSAFGLFMFMGAIACSLPIALLNDVSVRNWLLRGAGPLLFLTLYWLLPIETARDARFVVRALMFTFFVWAAKIVATLFLSEESSLIMRWTAIANDLLLPFNLVALCILLLDRSFSRTTRVLGILVFVTLTIGAGYRMHFLILAIFFSWYLMRSMARGRVVVPLLVIGCVAGVLAWFMSIEAGTALLDRFRELSAEGDSARVKEIKYAWERFLESPIFGKGLAFPIPLDVAYYGFEEYLAGVAEAYGHGYDHVSYMHNIVMYLLMDLGVFGLIAYALFVLPAIFGGAAGKVLEGEMRTGCRWALFSILFFTLIAATITVFQFNILVASLVAVLDARRYVQAPAPSLELAAAK